MEQTIRIIEKEMRSIRSEIEALDQQKSEYLDAALNIQEKANTVRQKHAGLSRELSSLYSKFPGVKRPESVTDEQATIAPKTALASKKSSHSVMDYDED